MTVVSGGMSGPPVLAASVMLPLARGCWLGVGEVPGDWPGVPGGTDAAVGRPAAAEEEGTRKNLWPAKPTRSVMTPAVSPVWQ